VYHRFKGLSFEAALRDIRASKPRDRVAAAEALATAESEDERELAFEALATAIGDARPEVRSTSCVSLAELSIEKAWEVIASCLSDQVPEVRQCAAIALGTLGVPDAFPKLLEALQEGPPDLRFQAASSLVEVDQEAAYAPLVEALDDTDGEVLGAIALALGAIGNAACADKLAELLDHKLPQTRLDAAAALAELGDIRAIEVLAAALPLDEGGWDAVTALESLGTAGNGPLSEFLATNAGSTRVRIRAAGALLGLPRAEGTASDDNVRSEEDEAGLIRAQSLLCDGLRSRKLEMRGLCLQELEAVGGTWSLAPLEHLRRSFRGRNMRAEIVEVMAAIRKRVDPEA
jgi:HEAT repeat protein